MMLLRFIVIAGVLVAISVYAPARAASAHPATRGMGATMALGADTVEQKKKDDTPRRPRPKPGPKDGGEDE